eukprot:COSAG01_NODE_34882_length_540_cov_1.961451_1_plen_41_part_01
MPTAKVKSTGSHRLLITDPVDGSIVNPLSAEHKQPPPAPAP